MKIAVTSANGQLGSTIIKQLIKEVGKENIIGIARTPEKAKHLGLEIRKGDYNSRSEFDAALQGIDTVILLSGMDEPQKRIQQHRNVIEAAKANGVTKIVYTSIIGAEKDNAFSPVVQSNRQTEQDVLNSGLLTVIGRNSIYIEPDLDYIETYIKEGGIKNCAGNGICTYTSRQELGYAYAKMATESRHNGQIYNLAGPGITQTELAKSINKVYQTKLSYQALSPEAYRLDRVEALGDFLGTIITGIYEGINQGAYDLNSDFEKAAHRPHLSPLEMILAFKNEHQN